jgi:hypothetical protein
VTQRIRSLDPNQRLAAGALAMFVMLAAVYSLSVGLRATRAASITGDEPFYLLTTQSLLQDGDLDLRRQYERESYREFFDHPEGLWRQSVPNPDGELLSPHETGLSVLVIPGFVVDGLRGVQVQLLLLAAATFSVAFAFAALETKAWLFSWMATALVGLSATAFVYSTEVYPEVPAALCLLLAVLLVRSERQGAVSGIVLAALLTALAWLGMKYGALGALVAVFFLLRASQHGRVALLGLSAVSGVAYIWAHYALFGDLTAYSVNTVHEGAGAGDVFRAHIGLGDRAYRLWGLFIDGRFGIGRWAPVLLLVPPSLPLLMRHGQVGTLVLALIACQLLIATFVAITMMGWWFPGRTLVVLLPLMPLVLALLLQRLSSTGRAIVLALGLCTLLFTALLWSAGSSGEVVLAGDPFEMQAPPFRWSSHLFPDYRAWTFETVVLTVAWLALAAGMAIALSRRRVVGRRSRISLKQVLQRPEPRPV